VFYKLLSAEKIRLFYYLVLELLQKLIKTRNSGAQGPKKQLSPGSFHPKLKREQWM
jgi:hypothetical protein